jgi:hypothetical protein
MIVVAIIGVMAVIAIPAFARARRKAQDTNFISDLRTVSDAFEIYASLHPDYPPDVNRRTPPAGIGEYLRRFDWVSDTPIGGAWDWDYWGNMVGVSVVGPGRTDDQMREIDAAIDDGNLGSGILRKVNDRFFFIIEEL